MSQDYGSEEKSAEIYGERVPFSGSRPEAKMDIKGKGAYSGLQGENKATTKDSFSVHIQKLIQKGRKQAIQMFRKPFWVIDFVNYGQAGRIIICEETYWIKIHEELDELRKKDDPLL